MVAFFDLFCLGHPPLHPDTKKAQKLPILNPIDMHGRVFWFSALSFMLSFMAWYAFPPLLAITIRSDLQLTRDQVLNSNIVALTAGFAMRFIAGPLCDRFGPRAVMIGILVLAAIPCGLAGTISNAGGLYAIRFFVGIAGASFVPCQVWCTGFFDKNVVGTANAFAAGWGNAGAGITYFVMPAVYDSLRTQRGLTSHVAWRVAFIVPTILLLAMAAAVAFLGQDTPTGKWSERQQIASRVVVEDNKEAEEAEKVKGAASVNVTDASSSDLEESAHETKPKYEVVAAPRTPLDIAKVVFTPQCAMLALPYACSFGGELAMNSILSSWYIQNFGWGQTLAANWAAMFGLLNVITRPAGGFIADGIYARAPERYGIKLKQFWYGFLVFAQGVMLLAIGLTNSRSPATLIGLIAGMACFMDAANGAAFSLVPHIMPTANGVLSGTVGASGNLGGIFWSVAYRFTSYAKATWIIGIGSLAIGALMVVVPPISRKQKAVGGYMNT